MTRSVTADSAVPPTTGPLLLVPARPFDLGVLAALTGRQLSDEQAEVVTAPLEAGVVVAGAGSGKTTVMVARVLWLVGRGLVAPDAVLGLTFTTKAADELAVRVRHALRALRSAGRLLDEQVDLEPVVSTYHAYAARLVRDHALRAGWEPTARLVSPATSWQLAARAVASYDGPMSSWRAESTVVQAVLALSADLAEHLVHPQQVRDLGERLRATAAAASPLPGDATKALDKQQAREQLLPVVDRYRRSKRERDLLDFGDVVALAAQLARDCPQVRRQERDTAHVVLLDEYQDTGAAQEVLLSSLFGDGHPVTAVGDPCQSIYGWRGASAGTLRRFPAAFGAPEARPRTLSTTYRSGRRILQLANLLSRELRAEGVAVPRLAADPRREDAGLVRCALLADVDAEAAWVAGQVRAAVLDRGPDATGRHWAQAAVLCRKRSMFPRLRAALEQLDVPVEVVGLGGLLAVPEVSDLVATLRVLDDPTADAALLRLLTGPRWRLGPRDLAVLGRHARTLVRAARRTGTDPLEAVVLGVDAAHSGSLVDALDDLPPRGLSEPGRARLLALRSELRALRARTDQPLPELVADVERTLGLDVEVAARPGAPDAAAARADLDAFADAAADFAGDVGQDGAEQAVLSAFLAHLAAAEDEEHGLDTGAQSGADTVKLMTVHAAKGLEWPVVAVPGLARSTSGGAAVFPGKAKSTSWLTTPRLLPFPLRGDAAELPRLAGFGSRDLAAFRTALEERDAREERRLAYVAVTRAQDLLLCSGYHWGEGSRVLGPSVFLDAARQACLDGAGDVAAWQDPPPPANPVSARDRTRSWPDPAAPAGPQVRAAAERVRALLRDGPPADDTDLRLDPAAAEQVRRWDDELARLAREEQRGAAGRATAALPSALSVSGLVDLRRDPAALSRSLRRPVPRRPSPQSRRGTAFHAWLESAVFGRPQLLDPFELPGSADADGALDTQLAALQAAFRTSAWWGRTPCDVEVPFEMQVEGVLVRGRMDAVYRTEHGYEVVDWKTGRVPRPGRDADAAAVQLATYRLAWSRLAGVPLDRVTAAFHHVAEDLTVRPVDLLDAQGLGELVLAVPVDDPT